MSQLQLPRHDSAGAHRMKGRSGSRLFAVATECSDLFPELLFTQLVAAGDGHSEGKLQLLQLMATLTVGTAAAGWRAGDRGPVRRGHGLGCSGAMAVWKCHGSLSFHCGTAAKGQAAAAS